MSNPDADPQTTSEGDPAAAEDPPGSSATPGDEAAAVGAAGDPEADPGGDAAGTEAPWDLDPVAPGWEDASSDPLAAALGEELGGAVESARRFASDLTLRVRRETIAQVAAALKSRGFTYLIDLCGADDPEREPRFEVVYHLHGFEENRRVRLKVAADESAPVPSVSGVWRGAGELEREVQDRYGIRFERLEAP